MDKELAKSGQEKQRQHEVAGEKTKRDKTKQDKTKQDKTRQGGNPQMSQQIQCDHSNYHNFLEQ